MVYEGSHKFHREFNEHFQINNRDDWYKLRTDEEEQFFVDMGCVARKIICPPGSLVLWDSRTIHCGSNPNKGRHRHNIRQVIYVCCTPKDLINSSDLSKKTQYFHNLRTTNHWPHKPKSFPIFPRVYGKNDILPLIVPIDPPVLTDLGLSLAGLN